MCLRLEIYLIVFPWCEVVGGLQTQAQVVIRHLQEKDQVRQAHRAARVTDTRRQLPPRRFNLPNH